MGRIKTSLSVSAHSLIATYCRFGNFRVKKLSYDKFSCKKIFVGMTPYRIIVNIAR